MLDERSPVPRVDAGDGRPARGGTDDGGPAGAAARSRPGPGSWGTAVGPVRMVRPGRSWALETIHVGDPFGVLVEVRIGRSIMAVVTAVELFVAVRNLSAGTTVTRRHRRVPIRPRDAELTQALESDIDAGWLADDGDLLDTLVTFKVTAGVHLDYDHGRSARVVAWA